MGRGATRVEVLMASGMASLVMLGATALWRLASTAYQEASVSAPAFRLAGDGMDDLSRQLRMCTAIHAPDAATLRPGFSPGERQPLVFVNNSGGTPTVMAVAQAAGGGLETWTYSSQALPPAHTWPVNPTTRRSFAAGATGLTIGWNGECPTLNLETWRQA